MRNLIALRGKPHLGKSQTVRTVVEMLTTKHPDAIIEHNHTTKADERVVLTINDSKIGVESQGDPNRLKESLELFARVGCDVIICSTRTRGKTVTEVNALPGFDIEWLEQREKSQPNEQVLRSLVTARNIVEKVETLIGSTAARTMSATA